MALKKVVTSDLLLIISYNKLTLTRLFCKESSLNCLLIIWVRSCFMCLEGSEWKQLRVFWNLAFYCKL